MVLTHVLGCECSTDVNSHDIHPEECGEEGIMHDGRHHQAGQGKVDEMAASQEESLSEPQRHHQADDTLTLQY